MLLLLFIFLLVSEILITEFAEELGPDAIIFTSVSDIINIGGAPVSMNILSEDQYVVSCIQMHLLVFIALERVEHNVFVIAGGIISV